MDRVMQSFLPFAPWGEAAARRLPGIRPLDLGDWLRVDEAYGGQMALRDRLMAEREGLVVGICPGAEAAVDEMYGFVLAHLPGGFVRDGDGIVRPDGVRVLPDARRPLQSLGRLVQQDLCVMQAGSDGEHVLTAAVLCFPAGWVLAEKLGRPMMRIHAPVARYTHDVGLRVQRLFDAIRVGAPLWRANAGLSHAPLFHPLSEGAVPEPEGAGQAPFVRSERQCMIRLPQTGAVVFSIHTYLVALDDLTPEQAAALAAHPIHQAR